MEIHIFANARDFEIFKQYVYHINLLYLVQYCYHEMYLFI